MNQITTNSTSNYGTSFTDLLEAKFHIGHLASRLHPKMKGYILGSRNHHSIFDLKHTWEFLQISLRFIEKIWRNPENKILFVSINSPGSQYLSRLAEEGGQPVLTKFWLPGSLTSKQKEELGLTPNLVNVVEDFESRQTKGERICAIFVLDNDPYFCRNLYKEANILGLPVISVVNTNFDPSLVSYPIPGNNRAISVYAYLSKVLLNLLQRTQK